MASDPLRWIDDELAALEAAGLRRRRMVREGPQGIQAIRWGGRELVNFGSNDYLGLAAGCSRHSVLQTIEQAGWGSGASPLITGRGTSTRRWSKRWLGSRAPRRHCCSPPAMPPTWAPSRRWPAKGTPSTWMPRTTLQHHRRLPPFRRSLEVYPHGDVDFLQRRLARRDDFRRRLIVTDSLFSMDGDFAPLADLAALAEQYDAMLMVDEAHATGVFGASGRGVCEELGVESGVHVRVGTLSKALGSMGGFVAGSAPLIDWLVNRARSYIFSTAPPEALAAAALEALDVVIREPARRTILRERAATLRAGLESQGWNIGKSGSQIVPVILGDPARTMNLARALQDRGFFVPGIRPPAVPQGECLLRISLSYLHGDEDLRRLLDALAEADGAGNPRRAEP